MSSRVIVHKSFISHNARAKFLEPLENYPLNRTRQGLFQIPVSKFSHSLTTLVTLNFGQIYFILHNVNLTEGGGDIEIPFG